MAPEGNNGKALVTGGAGFIGSHLCELLLDAGWEVFALDDLSTGSIQNVAHLRERSDFHLVVESVLSSSVVNELVYKCDVVYHLAAAVGVRLIVEQLVQSLVVNVQGTETVLEHCNRFGKRVLIASSSEVYGDHREERALSETDRRLYGPTTSSRWAYADSKAMDEFLALAYHKERGLDCVIARLFNTVGPRQSGRYGMVVPRFVQSALAGTPMEIFGDGMQVRSFCHVTDTTRALKGLMEDPHTSGEIYNVGAVEPITIASLAERVRTVTGSSSDVIFTPYERAYGQGIEDMIYRVPEIGKVRNAIDWRPSLDLQRILEDVVEFTKRAPVQLPEPHTEPAPAVG